MKATNPQIKTESFKNGTKIYSVVAQTGGKYDAEYFMSYRNINDAEAVKQEVEKSGEVDSAYWDETYKV